MRKKGRFLKNSEEFVYDQNILKYRDEKNMNIHQFNQNIEEIFGEHLHKYGDQFGLTNVSNEEFSRIGYATNLTLETIEEAKKENVDMMITHHAAWEFLYGMEEACTRRLKEYNI